MRGMKCLRVAESLAGRLDGSRVPWALAALGLERAAEKLLEPAIESRLWVADKRELDWLMHSGYTESSYVVAAEILSEDCCAELVVELVPVVELPSLGVRVDLSRPGWRGELYWALGLGEGEHAYLDLEHSKALVYSMGRLRRVVPVEIVEARVRARVRPCRRA